MITKQLFAIDDFYCILVDTDLNFYLYKDYVCLRSISLTDYPDLSIDKLVDMLCYQLKELLRKDIIDIHDIDTKPKLKTKQFSCIDYGKRK